MRILVRFFFIAVLALISCTPLAVVAETIEKTNYAFGGVYTDEHPGSTGHRNRANIYFFTVTKVSGKATVSIDADRPPKASTGNVWLRPVEGKGKIIGTWDLATFPKGPLVFDASAVITKPGKYEVEVAYWKGPWGLDINKVTIDTRK
jgi:hypothetical protein